MPAASLAAVTEPSTSLAPGMVLSAKAFGPSVPPWCAPLWAWPAPALNMPSMIARLIGQSDRQVVGGIVLVLALDEIQFWR